MALMQVGLQMAAGKLPKVIKPRPHAVIDYAVAGSFLLMGALWWKRNRRAAVGCFICGGATATNSLLTDYPGGIFREITYRNHGRIDAVIAGLTASIPGFMNFKDEPEARFFGSSGVGQTAITSLTDFKYYQDPFSRRRRRRKSRSTAQGAVQRRSRLPRTQFLGSAAEVIDFSG
jgi:hypothetical protein